VSLPQTAEEIAQFHATEAAGGLTGNVVSTACPDCDTRFAMLATFHADGWQLRCTVCGTRRNGELKP
jgi:hypothetical protein